VAALGLIPVQLTCVDTPFGYCGNNLLWSALLFLLGFCGLVLALIASIQGIVKTVKRRQWFWLLGLVTGFLAPLPVGFALAAYLAQAVYGTDVIQPYLPISVGLLLTPTVALVYSSKYEAASEVKMGPTR